MKTMNRGRRRISGERSIKNYSKSKYLSFIRNFIAKITSWILLDPKERGCKREDM